MPIGSRMWVSTNGCMPNEVMISLRLSTPKLAYLKYPSTQRSTTTPRISQRCAALVRTPAAPMRRPIQ